LNNYSHNDIVFGFLNILVQKYKIYEEKKERLELKGVKGHDFFHFYLFTFLLFYFYFISLHPI